MVLELRHFGQYRSVFCDDESCGCAGKLNLARQIHQMKLKFDESLAEIYEFCLKSVVKI